MRLYGRVAVYDSLAIYKFGGGTAMTKTSTGATPPSNRNFTAA